MYRCTLDHAILREGEATTWRASADEGDGIDRLALSLGTDPASQLSPARGALIVAASDDGTAADASIVITSVRWGRRDVGDGGGREPTARGRRSAAVHSRSSRAC